METTPIIFSERTNKMGRMKEKFTEAQEALWNSYSKLHEAKDILESETLREDDMIEHFGEELTKLSSGIEFALWLFERSKLFEEFGLELFYQETYWKKENESETQETGA